MGGWLLDVVVEFLVRAIALEMRRARSRNWPTVTATIFQTYVESKTLGCSVATVSYDYLVGSEKYSATHDEPSFSQSGARRFAQSYPAGKQINVRYKSDDPSRSVALI